MSIQPSAASSIIARQRRFVGVTDKYMPVRETSIYQQMNSDVPKEPTDELAFLSSGVLGSIFNELYKNDANNRLEKYRRFVRFYKGEHWDNPYHEGEKKPVFNFCKIVVNKSADFFCNKGFTVRSGVARQTEAASIFDAIWESNNKITLVRALGVGSSLLGDSFLYISVETNGSANKSDWTLKLYHLDAFFVFPVFDDKEPGTLRACVLRIPVGQTNGGGMTQQAFDTIAFTKDKIISVKADGTEMIAENGAGVVPVVHFPNYRSPITQWGESDIDGVVDLNVEYNSVMLSVRKIIKYHAEPTTIVYGAKASRLEKGANKVWSGLPVDGRVENLAFNSDLGATYRYLEKIEDNIHKTAEIPAVLFQTDRAVSHASAVAMKMLYQPILEKNVRKTEAFNEAFRSACKVMGALLKYMGTDISKAFIEGETYDSLYAEFPDPLPYDEAAAVDLDLKKLGAGIVSVVSLIRKYNPECNLAEVSDEIIADALSKVFAQIEVARGAKGEAPDINSVLVSSVAKLSPETADALTKTFEAFVSKKETIENNQKEENKDASQESSEEHASS